MRRAVIAAMIAVFVCGTSAYAANNCVNCAKKDPGTKTVNVVTDTAQTAVSGTVNVAETSVSNTIAVPQTAIQAVEDTAGTAVSRADAALKALTGEDGQ